MHEKHTPWIQPEACKPVPGQKAEIPPPAMFTDPDDGPRPGPFQAGTECKAGTGRHVAMTGRRDLVDTPLPQPVWEGRCRAGPT